MNIINDMFNEGMMILNKKCQIVYIDEQMKLLYPDVTLGDSGCCEKSHPCPSCRMQEYLLDETKSTRGELRYLSKHDLWIIQDISHMEWPQEGMCVMLFMRKLLNDQHQMSLRLNEKAKYEVAAEFYVKTNAYHMLYNEIKGLEYPSSGLLLPLIESICFQYIYHKDQKNFLHFWDITTIKHRVERLGYISQDFRVQSRNGEYRWMSFYINQGDEKHKEDAYLVFVMDAQRKYELHHKTLEDQLFQVLDPLTGLYNFVAFKNKVKEMIHKEPIQSYGIVNIDIEHFKLFNDWYGTKEGDKLLVYLADKIKQKVQECQGVGARLGGDDFMMLLPQKDCSQHQIELEIMQWMKEYDKNIKFLPSGGIYMIEDLHTSVTLMCDRANLALNTIKGNYTKRVAVYDHRMKQKLENEQEVLFGVKQGLSHQEFEVYFQPQYNARSNQIIGAEALIRWNHPTKGLLQPGEFVPILETSGFISQLDYYVWEHVCMFLHDRLSHHKPVVPISVNVSRMDIYQYHIPEIFQHLIQKYEIPPYLLEIEITESAYCENITDLMSSVKALRELGFLVLMDDFGSGFSSLNMLKDIEVDVLKLDMKFISDSESSLKSSSILESMIHMGKWLEIRMIAEGVETKEQVENLLNLNCDYMQGYYFHRPMNVDDFCELLSSEKVDIRGIEAESLPSIEIQDLLHRDITSEAMLNNILGGIALYELHPDQTLEIKAANQMYYQITGGNAVSGKEHKENIWNKIYIEDLKTFQDIFKKAEKSPVKGASGVFRRYRMDGSLMWIHFHAFYLRKEGNVKCFYGAVSDYSETMNLQKDRMRLLETIPGDVIELRVKGNVFTSRRVVSAGLAKAHGYNLSEYRAIVDQGKVRSLIHKDDLDKYDDMMHNPSKWNEFEYLEIRDVTKNGSIIWVELRIRYVECEGDEKIYNLLCTDITNIKLQEQELRNSQAVLQNILGKTYTEDSALTMAKRNREEAGYLFAESISGGMVGGYCEPGFPLYFANDEFITMLGYTSYQDFVDGIQGKVEHTIYVEDRQKVENEIGVMELGHRYTTKYRMVKKDGSLLWVVDRGCVVKAEDGRLAIISICIDISDETNAQMELEQAQRDHSVLNSIIPGGYHQCYDTPEFDIKHVSDRFLRMLEYTREEIQEKFHNKYINMIYPEDREKVMTFVKDQQTSSVYIGEYRMYGKHGLLWVRDQTRLVTYEQERFFVGIIEDISDLVTTKQEMEAILLNTPGDVFSVVKGELTFYSYNLAKALGYSFDEYKKMLKECKGSMLTDPRDREYIHEACRKAKQTHTDVDLIFRSIAKNQETRYIHLKATYSGIKEGEGVYYGILIDATAMIIKDRELRISQQMYESIIQQANLDVWEYEVRNDRITMSKDGAKLLSNKLPSNAQITDHQIILTDFLHETLDTKEMYAWQQLRKKLLYEDFKETVLELKREEEIRWVKITCEGIYTDEKELVKVVGYVQDITLLVEQEQSLQEEKRYARLDNLTGVYNRRMGDHLMKERLSQLGNNEVAALLMVDLDNFKQINDQFGHAQGDHVLKEVTEMIQSKLDQQDIFARYGGDEFSILMCEKSISDIKIRMKRLKQSLEHDTSIPYDMLGISIGIAIAPLDGTVLEVLYKKADQALYRAKLQGKNRYVIYQEEM